MRNANKQVAILGGGLLATGLAPSAASACDTITMCIDWTNVAMEDAAFGDVAVTSTIPARNARVDIIRPYPEPAIGAFLDSEGCVEFDSRFRAGHKVKVFTEVVLDWDTSDHIQIKSFESSDAADADQDSFIAVDIIAVPGGFQVQGQAPVDSGLVASNVAVAAEGLANLQSRAGSPLTGGHRMEIALVAGQNACAGSGRVNLGTSGFDWALGENTSSLRKKFLLMHEVGHWINFQLDDEFPPINYDYGPCSEEMGDPMLCDSNVAPLDPAITALGNPYNEPCRFTVEDLMDESGTNPARHGIRSAEFSGGSAVEGFAHFVSAAALNTSMASDVEGAFRYYKNVDEAVLPSYETFEAANRQVSLRGGSSAGTLGGRNRWVELQCPDDWGFPYSSGTSAEITTQLDWLRFFWRFVTAPSAGARPTFWETVEYVAFVGQQTGGDALSAFEVWESYETGVLSPSSPAAGYSTRFYDLSDEHGIYNAAP